MLKKRAGSLLTVLALAGFAACGGGDVESDAVVTDTIIEQDVEMVEVPVTVPDTSVVTRDVDVDTVDIGSVDTTSNR